MLTSVYVKVEALNYWGEGRYYFKSEGPKIVPPSKNVCPENCNPPL